MNKLINQEQFNEISKVIDAQIGEVLTSNVNGFQKAYVMSSAISIIKEQLSDEYMKPIMQLQGTSLGFKTDQDSVKEKQGQKWVTVNGPGYPLEIVRDCLIEATFLGLEVTGNQFNIIGGNMYPTREGFGALLDKMQGLKKNFTYKEIRQPSGQKVANVIVQIDWQLGDESPRKQVIDFPIKSNEYTSYDALIGKAERKAKRWLFNTIKGTDISDGDVNDIPHTVVGNEISDGRYDLIVNLIKTASLNESEKSDIDKIVNDKESSSYDKAIKFLKSKQ